MKLIDPRSYAEWNSLISSNGINSCFFSSEWAQVLSSTYGYLPYYLTSIETDKILITIPIMFIKGNISGFRAISLPFTDFCFPFYRDKEYLLEALSFLIKLGKKVGLKYFELRGINDDFLIKTYSYYFMHTLDLTQDEERLYKNLKENARRNIKKAIKQDVKINLCNSLFHLHNFYRLNCLTRKRHGLPPQPFKFFINLYNYIIKNNMGQLISAQYQGKIIASSLFLNFGNQAIYKYGASDNKYTSLNANHLIFWTAVKFYKSKDIHYLNFGRTEPENSGLLRYKRLWGASEEIIRYARYSFDQKDFISAKKTNIRPINSFLNKLSYRTLKIIGNYLYGYFG